MPTRSLTLLLTLTIVLSCKDIKTKQTQLIEGDLYFSFFRLGNLYGAPDSVANNVHSFADTANRALQDSATLALLTIYDTLKREKLLYSPYVDLKLDNDSIITIILTKDDYHKIAPTNYQHLLDTRKKIRIKAEVRQIVSSHFYCNKLLLIDTLDGETLRKSTKLKIDDYH